jgi:chorismate mutase
MATKEESLQQTKELAVLLDDIYKQIKNYPTPITGCDEQFNYLLEERNRLREMIEQIKSNTTTTTQKEYKE